MDGLGCPTARLPDVYHGESHFLVSSEDALFDLEFQRINGDGRQLGI